MNSPKCLDFLYDFEKKEFILRFGKRDQAQLYQATNNEARILEDYPNDVWLPLPLGITSLRNSSVGMAVVFQSNTHATNWQKRIRLGSIDNTSKEVSAVYLKQDWSPEEIEEELNVKRPDPRPRPQSGGSNIQRGTSTGRFGGGIQKASRRRTPPERRSASGERKG
ncbi:hypothetical protein HDV57DRAFT_488735 [Trichoderma longibrachiatum]